MANNSSRGGSAKSAGIKSVKLSEEMLAKINALPDIDLGWTEEEDEVIRVCYGKKAYKDISQVLPNRSTNSIRHRADKLIEMGIIKPVVFKQNNRQHLKK